MVQALEINEVEKVYANGFKSLKGVTLQVAQGEIFALLGPNGAGKTTLISSICGITNITKGRIAVFGYDHKSQYRQARQHIGLVPQELTTDTFETVWKTVSFSRELFGKKANPDYIETILKKLSLWEKKDSQIRKLSGGMKRRVMIAKALAHEPKLLFLDEPTAGVDVSLRQSMWQEVSALRENGTTVILTTHYIEEAEHMADRIAVINKGQLVLTEEKNKLMKTLGKKELILHLQQPLLQIPESLAPYELALRAQGRELVLTYDPAKQHNKVAELLDQLQENHIRCHDLDTKHSSLEEIFVTLVNKS